MAEGDKETIAGVSAELKHFAKSQERFNEVITNAVEKFAETSTKSAVLTAEMENLKVYVSDIHTEQKSQGDKISTLKDEVKVNTLLSNQVQKLKYMILAAFFSVAISVTAWNLRPAPEPDNKVIEQIVQLLEAQKKANANEK